MQIKYTPEQLEHIKEQAFIYQCACPTQVCLVIDAMMKLYKYQQECLSLDNANDKVHTTIAKTAERCYSELEQCLRDVLILEGWDLETLAMPDNLHKRLMDTLSNS